MHKESYALGISFGQELKRAGMQAKDVVFEDIIQGVRDIVEGATVKLDLAEASETLNNLVSKKEAEMAIENHKASDAFFAENGNKEGVITTDDGLQYRVIKEGEGETIKEDDVVLIQAYGSFLNGTRFWDTSKTSGPIRLNVGTELIEGLFKGLQLMKKGSHYNLFVPHNLAYGPHGTENFPGYAALVFDIEVIDVYSGGKVPLDEEES